MNKNNIAIVLLIIGVYVFFSGVSYMVFSQTKSQTSSPATTTVKPNAKGSLMFDENLPKTEPCPLNGAKYSKQQRDWWEKHGPLGVAIENHQESRPQSGLSSADVVYEAVAEGGITRFLAVYYCQDAEYIGPIRSARTYFIDFLSEYGEFPLYAHVGGANRPGPANALGQIGDYGWANYNDLDQFRMGCPIYCQLENRLGRKVAIEHTMYSSTTKLWDFAKSGKSQKRKLTNVDEEGNAWDEKFVPYTFKKEEAKLADRSVSQEIHMEFWEDFGQYEIDWTYDKESNTYKRKNAKAVHKDLNTDKQLAAKNVVVLYMQETHLNDLEKHLLYKTKGTGKAVVFMDGKETTGTWRKASRTARTLLFDAKGKAIEYNPGLLWFVILPTDGVLEVK